MKNFINNKEELELFLSNHQKRIEELERQNKWLEWWCIGYLIWYALRFLSEI